MPDRRFYIASPSMRVNPSDFDLFEEERLKREADFTEIVQLRARGASHPSLFGLPRYRETPEVKVALRNKPLDFYGFDRWVLSSRARTLLLDADPQGFDFVECETTAPNRHVVEPYWLGGVRRVLDDFDREASSFEVVGRQYDVGLEKWTNSESIRKLNRLVLHGGQHEWPAFYLVDYSTYPISSGQLVDRIREAPLTGLMFSPLHPPSSEDLKESYISTRKYWASRGGA